MAGRVAEYVYRSLSFPPVRRLFNGLNRLAAAFVLPPLVSRLDLRLERLGSDYGGWVVPTSLLHRDSICYSGGIGEDISFDLALIARFGCKVFAFDPTPRSIEFVAREAAGEPRFVFKPVGLWSTKTVLKFFAPKDPRHVSHSVVNLQGTSSYFEAPCDRLSAIMNGLGHRRIDLLKIDIEGAEWDVLDTVIDDGLDIAVVCVEFDQPALVTRIRRMAQRLLAAGYALVAIDRWSLTFVQRTVLAGGPQPGQTLGAS